MPDFDEKGPEDTTSMSLLAYLAVTAFINRPKEAGIVPIPISVVDNLIRYIHERPGITTAEEATEAFLDALSRIVQKYPSFGFHSGPLQQKQPTEQNGPDWVKALETLTDFYK